MNDIGEIINDYTIIDHCRGKDNAFLSVAKCNICGHIKKMKYAELKRFGCAVHSKINCKIDYYLNLDINSDYIIDQSLEPITKSKHILTPFRCKICGHVRYMPLDRYGISPWKHNVHNCGEDVYKERIGEQVDDYKVIDYIGLRASKNGNKNPIFKCQCQICKRIKNIELSNLTQHHGTTHHSCSQLLDRNQPYFENFEKKWADQISRAQTPCFSYGDKRGTE